MVEWGPLLGLFGGVNTVLLGWLHVRSNRMEEKLDKKVDKADCERTSNKCQGEWKHAKDVLWDEVKGHAHTPDGRVIVRQG